MSSMHRLDLSLFFLAREWPKGAGFENVICVGSLICAVFIVPVGVTYHDFGCMENMEMVEEVK